MITVVEDTAMGQDLWTEGVHPLINSMDAHLQTWAEWKSQFRQAKFYDYYEMLIRRGFHMNASYEEGVERILFYLRMAEGHCNSRTLEKPEDRAHQKSTMRWASWWTERVGTERDWRRSLAHLAYKEFVANFMRSHETNVGGIARPPYNPWEEWIVDERVMKAFLHFFRVEGSEMPNFQLSGVSDADKQVTKIVTGVLVKLSSIRWHVSEDVWSSNPDDNESLQKLLERYALSLLEILFVLKRLDVLGRRGVYVSGYTKEPSRLGEGGGLVPEWSPVLFTNAELGKLRELALSERTWTPDMGYLTENDRGWTTITSNPRTPHSIQEALRIGASQAATIYALICDRQGIDWRK